MNLVAPGDLRRAVVLAVRSGMSQTQASRVFGVSVRAANKWVAIDRTGGLRALRPKRRGRRAGDGRLNREQATSIEQLIIDSQPEQLKLPFYLWTRAALVNLIEREYGIAVSLTTASRYLNHWGMSLHQPAANTDERTVIARWRKERYRAVVRQAKRDNAVIYWGNRASLRKDHGVGFSNSHRGKMPNAQQAGHRSGCNMISAMSNRGRHAFIISHGKFDGAQFVHFLQRLLKQAGTKVYLIVQGNPVHRSSDVRRFVKANAAQIRLIDMLRPDSELARLELRDAMIKYKGVGRGRLQSRGTTMPAVRRHLRQRQPRMIRSDLRDKHARYPA
jgi:transposase